MKPDNERVSTYIDSLNDADQIQLLTRLIYELTIAGRMAYAVDSNGLERPVHLREINELQHKLSAHMMSVLVPENEPRSSAFYVNRILAPNHDDSEFANELRRCLMNSLEASVEWRRTENP